jgi:O-antigen/teichoic acid export membrane protein
MLNIAGQAAPIVVALATIPYLIERLGPERFGILTLAWAFVGYFSFLDLGLGRALTQIVARKIGEDREEAIPEIVATGLGLLCILGILGTGIAAIAGPILVHDVFKVSDDVTPEALIVFRVVAFTMPLVVLAAGLRGVLQAYQRFGVVNAVRVAVGSLTFLAPLVAVLFSTNLGWVIGVLAVVRVVACAIYLRVCLDVIAPAPGSARFNPKRVGPLLHFGGWITISTIVANLMIYWDRFLISAVLSVATLAYYVTPYEIIIRLSILPSAFVATLFPAFSVSFGNNPDHTRKLLERASRVMIILMFPVALGLVTLADESLLLWLGPEFAENSTLVLQLMATGLFLNAIAQMPFSMIQGAGRPDLATKFYLIQLPPYLLGIWFMARLYGLEGVALVWMLRILVDLIGFSRIAAQLLKRHSYWRPRAQVAVGLALCALVPGFLSWGTLASMLYVAAIGPLFLALAWRFLLLESERRFLATWAAQHVAPAEA